MKKSIGIVIVTFNRSNYLINLLNELIKQTIDFDSILIVDNHSNDGTPDKLIELGIINSYKELAMSESQWKNKRIYYYRNDSNTGGSGGFKKAFEMTKELRLDYIWAMDDDVIPEKNCLEKMLNGMDDDHLVCIPNRNDENYIDRAILGFNWNNPFKASADKKSVLVQESMQDLDVVDFAFEGPLFDISIIKKIGIPDDGYFIFYDDSDFAQRCTKLTKIKYITEARLHKQIVNNNINNDFTWRSYYICRNEIIFDRRYNPNKLISLIRPYILLAKRTIHYVFTFNFKACRYSYRAFRDGIQQRMGKTIEPGSL